MIARGGTPPLSAASCLSTNGRIGDGAVSVTAAKFTSARAASCLAQPAARRASAAAAQDGECCAPYWAARNTTTVPQKYPTGRQFKQLCGYTGMHLRALYGLASSDTGAGQTIVIDGTDNRASTLADASTTFATNGVAAHPASRYQVKTYTSSAGASGSAESTLGLE